MVFYAKTPGVPAPEQYRLQLLGKRVDERTGSEELDWEFIEIDVPAPAAVSGTPPEGFPRTSVLINDWALIQRQHAICWHYIRQKNYDAALAAMELVRVEDADIPGKSIYWYNKLWCLEKLARYEEAEEAAERYLEVVTMSKRQPDSPTLTGAREMLASMRAKRIAQADGED